MDVSVIIPVYNVEDYLNQCLTSVEQNNEVSLEIIAVNDGSTDGSLAIMQAHAARDSRIRVIDKENQGYGASVNRGIAESTGEYIAIVEPDDFVKPHMYDRLIAFARTFAEKPDVVKSAYWRIQDPDTPDELFCRNTYYKRIHVRKQPFTLKDAPRLIQHHPSIWTALYLRSFLDEFGIRLVECPGAGWVDNPFMIDTLARARRIVYTDECFYCYRDRVPGRAPAVTRPTSHSRVGTTCATFSMRSVSTTRASRPRSTVWACAIAAWLSGVDTLRSPRCASASWLPCAGWIPM